MAKPAAKKAHSKCLRSVPIIATPKVKEKSSPKITAIMNFVVILNFAKNNKKTSEKDLLSFSLVPGLVLPQDCPIIGHTHFAGYIITWYQKRRITP